MKFKVELNGKRGKIINKKLLKAQMSLEMIIGLLILVVVAAVIINTFIIVVPGGIGNITGLKDTTEYAEFQSQCQKSCREYATSGNLGAAVAFCTTRLFPEGTRNKIGKPGDVDIISPKTPGANVFLLRPWEVCEDAIFCFHVFDCREYGTITIEDCRKILCEYFSEKHKDATTGAVNYDGLESEIIETFRGKAKNVYGSCNLGRENWWTRYFVDQNTGRICVGIV